MFILITLILSTPICIGTHSIAIILASPFTTHLGGGIDLIITGTGDGDGIIPITTTMDGVTHQAIIGDGIMVTGMATTMVIGMVTMMDTGTVIMMHFMAHHIITTIVMIFIPAILFITDLVKTTQEVLISSHHPHHREGIQENLARLVKGTNKL